jgi:hypothetical protein
MVKTGIGVTECRILANDDGLTVSSYQHYHDSIVVEENKISFFVVLLLSFAFHVKNDSAIHLESVTLRQTD